MRCVISILFLVCIYITNSEDLCKWNKSHDSPNIYWINMDKSVDRRIAMRKHLDDVVGSSKHFRVRGITLNDIYIPADIAKHWGSYSARYETTEVIPPRNQTVSGDKMHNYKMILSSLFGRRGGNTWKELGCTISHLFAMRQAIKDPNSQSKYALIIEDDIEFLFNVDYNAMVATGKSTRKRLNPLFYSPKFH